MLKRKGNEMKSQLVKKQRLLLIMLLSLFASCSVLLADNHDHGEAHIYEGAQAYYLAEHGDFEIAYEDGELALHIHLHKHAVVDGNELEEDTEFTPEQLIIVATEAAEIHRPDDAVWEATGVHADEELWVLPQQDKAGLPAFGFSSENIPTGVFVGDMVQLRLRAIQGPGDFSLWENNAFGIPAFHFSTHEDQLDADFSVGLHAHFNWGFSAVGDYILVFEAKAELLTGEMLEALSIFNFKVTEIPLCLSPLAGDVNGDCVVDEHDLDIVEANLGQSAPAWPGDQVLEGPNDGFLYPVFNGEGTQVGTVEIKLHDDAGDIEAWLTRDGEPWRLPLDTVLSLNVPELGKQVTLAVRDQERNEDESGASTIFEGTTNYFIFPGETGADASWLMGEDFKAKAELSFEDVTTGSFILKPHGHHGHDHHH